MALFSCAGRSTAATEFMEQLEQRVLLSDTPFPKLTDMVDPRNTLVRIETDLGTIDLEMFDVAGPDEAAPAPNTVANFLDRIRLGDYDNSFIHRFARGPGGQPFVVQMGGFRWSDEDGLSRVEPRGPIQNEFDSGRKNLAKTVAMARLGGDVNSATSQFFFNMKDNANLDQQQFTVFGHVVNNASWNVVLKLRDLTVEDFRADISDPLGNALNEVPTLTDIPNNEPPTEEVLIDLTNVEVIKAADTEVFFTTRMAYPEGYRSGTIIEHVDLVNMDANESSNYQIIIRYEDGPDRDHVIDHGTLLPNEHKRVRISDFNDPDLDLVRPGRPFAYEIQATTVIAATLHHFDFGAWTREAFINPALLPAGDLSHWTFGGMGRIAESPAPDAITRFTFLVWQNLDPDQATISLTFTREDNTKFAIERTVEGRRRGGLEVFNLGQMTDDVVSIRLVSNRRVVAALTVYDQISDEAADVHRASVSTGTIGGGASEGALAGARYNSSGGGYISVLSGRPASTTVAFTFTRANGQKTTDTLVVPALGRAVYNLADSGMPENEFFAIRYEAPGSSISATYVSVLGGDAVSTPFATRASSLNVFSGTSYDPDAPGTFEIFSFYNPNLKDDGAVRIFLSFHFVGDDKISGSPELEFVIGPGGRRDVSIASLSSILAKIRSGSQFQTFAVSINSVSEGGMGGGSITASIVSQLTSIHMGGGSSSATLASMLGGLIPINSPFFDTGG